MAKRAFLYHIFREANIHIPIFQQFITAANQVICWYFIKFRTYWCDIISELNRSCSAFLKKNTFPHNLRQREREGLQFLNVSNL